jgi:hypothetical protein
MPLTFAQTSKVVDQLRSDGDALLRKVTAARDEGESGVVHGALWLFGQDEDSQLDAQVGAVSSILRNIDSLLRLAPLAGQTDDDADKFVSLAKVIAVSLNDVAGYSGESTLSWVIQSTARKTGEDVKEGINEVAKAGLGFVWSALPWWAIVGAIGVVGALVVLKLRAVRA